MEREASELGFLLPKARDKVAGQGPRETVQLARPDPAYNLPRVFTAPSAILGSYSTVSVKGVEEVMLPEVAVTVMV